MSAHSQKFISFLKQTLIRVTIFILSLAIAGTVYQTAATESDQRKFPPPGNLIDVGGFKMHIYCEGEGSPTVILEAMSGGMSAYWGWIQPEVAKEARVCVYDRAGFGWSESDPEAPTLARTVRNLHTLLLNANIEGPYLLAGHSLGGIYLRQFAADYPDQVLGMVLIDEANPQQFARYPELFSEGDQYLRISGIMPTVARLGAYHLYFALGGEMDFADLTEPQRAEVKAIWSSPQYFAAQRAEMEVGREIWGDALKLKGLGDLPLMVVSRGTGLDHDWSKYEDDLAALSTNSRRITVEGSSHTGLMFNPNYAHKVSMVILQMIDVIKTGNRLAP